MWRKTRRLSKKRRRYTKKRRNVKRTHKYKFLRGGLGDNDYVNIGIGDIWSFNDATKIDEFKTYVFGTEQHAEAWINIMTECRKKGIPFYILTSGNRLGIIRTLQLLGLSELVTEVLCNNSSVTSNPLHLTPRGESPSKNAKRHEIFRKINKYQIIQRILAGRCNQHDYTCIFIDNDERNKYDHDLCSNVEFIHATGDKINIYDHSHYSQPSFMSYVFGLSRHPILSFYFDSKTELIHKMYYLENTNLVKITLLDTIFKRVNDGEIKILFADFDGTMSPWGGALSFQLPAFTQDFNKHFKVGKSSL